VKLVGVGFLTGMVVAFALAVRSPQPYYRASEFARAGVSSAWSQRQAARANLVAAAFVRGDAVDDVVVQLEAAFAVPWYATGRGPGEESFPLRARASSAVVFVARDPSSPWYRRASRSMVYDAQFVGRRPIAYQLQNGREVFAGELVEDRTGVTYRTGSASRAQEIFQDAVDRVGKVGGLPASRARRELASAMRGILLALPYGERTAAFAEAFVAGAHLATVGEPLRLYRDARGEFDRAAWTSMDDEEFGLETGFEKAREPSRRLSGRDGGI
jgi:hypothetical protein